MKKKTCWEYNNKKQKNKQKKEMLLGKKWGQLALSVAQQSTPFTSSLPIVNNQGMIVVELVVCVAFAFPQKKT